MPACFDEYCFCALLVCALNHDCAAVVLFEAKVFLHVEQYPPR